MGSTRLNRGSIRNPARVVSRVGYFWLLAVLLGCLPIFASGADRENGSVYCPLQKVWVRNGTAAAKPQSSFLREVCASGSSKLSFTYESFRRLNVLRLELDAEQAEELFFEYSKKGTRAFNNLKTERVPGKNIAHDPASEKSAGNGQISREKKAEKLFVFDTPPNSVLTTAEISFPLPALYPLEAHLRRSRSRAPPVSI